MLWRAGSERKRAKGAYRVLLSLSRSCGRAPATQAEAAQPAMHGDGLLVIYPQSRTFRDSYKVHLLVGSPVRLLRPDIRVLLAVFSHVRRDVLSSRVSESGGGGEARTGVLTHPVPRGNPNFSAWRWSLALAPRFATGARLHPEANLCRRVGVTVSVRSKGRRGRFPPKTPLE